MLRVKQGKSQVGQCRGKGGGQGGGGGFSIFSEEWKEQRCLNQQKSQSLEPENGFRLVSLGEGSVCCVINLEPQQGWGIALPVGSLQRTGTQQPSGRGRACEHSTR